MSTDVRTPFLGTPLVPLKPLQDPPPDEGAETAAYCCCVLIVHAVTYYYVMSNDVALYCIVVLHSTYAEHVWFIIMYMLRCIVDVVYISARMPSQATPGREAGTLGSVRAWLTLVRCKTRLDLGFSLVGSITVRVRYDIKRADTKPSVKKRQSRVVVPPRCVMHVNCKQERAGVTKD